MLEVLNYLKCTVHTAVEKARNLVQEYNRVANDLEKHITLRVNEVLRERLIGEIEWIIKPVFREADEKIEFYENSPLFESEKEVLIAALNEPRTKAFDFYVYSQPSIWSIESEKNWEKEHPDSRFTPAEELAKRVAIIKNFILNGKLDYVLGMRGKEVLWEIMGSNGKLLATIS